ncbi:MAG: RNA polymerase sigma factor RpoD/SigA [Candidatus Fermentibacteraceae bacterium]|nr:RNA polymerase sigma factor RpoD/SigA [Candidatus Fermentibacteraceae bacterium]MBN2609189.1 RNA polymerase sigma factor RpoD/SigA [Candidatus Fermentibacteraceae bacterium]
MAILATKRTEGRSLELYLREIGSKETLSSEEEAALAKRIRSGEQEALNELTEANLRFVVSIAKQYANQGVALEDLINEGNVGLIRAAKGFDESKGCRFITYAVWWIRQAILQALAEQSRIVRLPLNRVGELYKMGRAARELGHSLGRNPSTNEIADELDVSRGDVEGMMSIHSTHLSLDSPVYEGSDKTFQEMISDDEDVPPDEAVVQTAMKRSVSGMLEILDQRERTIIQLFFGINTDRRHTLAEIGRTMGISRERVRQLKNRAISKLNDKSDSKNLLLYLK